MTTPTISDEGRNGSEAAYPRAPVVEPTSTPTRAGSAGDADAEVNCRGCWQLGNNCKKCPRCLRNKPAEQAAAEGYAPKSAGGEEPFAYFDHFNDEFTRSREQAERAIAGGNLVRSLYTQPQAVAVDEAAIDWLKAMKADAFDYSWEESDYEMCDRILAALAPGGEGN